MSTNPPLWETPGPGQSWPAGYNRLILDEVDSTMAEAARRLPELAGPTWIMARRQTAGHGRRGRPWTDTTGNFAATLVLRPSGTAAQAGLRSFTAAVALFRTLAMTAGPEADQRLSLKWPNDVLLDGGKVAGILLESAGRGAGLDWLSIGIGVNLHAAPGLDAVEPGALSPVSVAGQGLRPFSQDDMLFWLANHFADLEAQFQMHGFAPVRSAWLAQAARLGERITARTAREEITGTFDSVDEAGNLVLNTAKSRVAIPAADVFF